MSATIRSQPEDFIVHERLGFEFSGDGEHDYLHVEKTGANTEWVSRQLAQFAEVPACDVGYSGLKDRHAVTRQWFSVPRWHAPDWSGLEVEGVSVIGQERHSRKLRRGAHEDNFFRIVLRGNPDATSDIERRLKLIRMAGVPNYFGEQRFGRGGSNVALSNSWAAGKRLPRHKRSIAISSARSYLFNQLLDARVREQTWNRVLAGDVVNLDGSGSIFSVEAVDSDIEKRCAEMDVHPTAVLWGEGAPVPAFASDYGHWLAALRNARVKPDQRSLRLRVMDLKWEIGSNSLTLEFALRRGAYATAVLREIASLAAESR